MGPKGRNAVHKGGTCPCAHILQLLLFEQEDGFVKELSTAMQLLRNCLYRNEEGKVSSATSQIFIAV